MNKNARHPRPAPVETDMNADWLALQYGDRAKDVKFDSSTDQVRKTGRMMRATRGGRSQPQRKVAC